MFNSEDLIRIDQSLYILLFQNLIMILYIIIIVAFSTFVTLKLKIKRIPQCAWYAKNISYDKSRRDICKKYVDIINSLGIYYFISFGSQLGAVRNGGLIKNDVDIDIVLPISKNKNIFKCNEDITITNKYYENKLVLLENNTLLCNKSRIYYTKLLHKYLIRKFEKYGIIKTRLIAEVLAIYISKELYLDIYPTIANEWVWRDYKICKCQFCDTTSYCHVNAYNLTKLLYGNEYFIPKNKKSPLPLIRIKKDSIK